MSSTRGSGHLFRLRTTLKQASISGTTSIPTGGVTWWHSSRSTHPRVSNGYIIAEYKKECGGASSKPPLPIEPFGTQSRMSSCTEKTGRVRSSNFFQTVVYAPHPKYLLKGNNLLKQYCCNTVLLEWRPLHSIFSVQLATIRIRTKAITSGWCPFSRKWWTNKSAYKQQPHRVAASRYHPFDCCSMIFMHHSRQICRQRNPEFS